MGGVEQDRIFFTVRIPVCVNRRVREPDPGSNAQARPRDSRVWSGWSRDSSVDIPVLHGLGNAFGVMNLLWVAWAIFCSLAWQHGLFLARKA